jgi:hypothetical protein
MKKMQMIEEVLMAATTVFLLAVMSVLLFQYVTEYSANMKEMFPAWHLY